MNEVGRPLRRELACKRLRAVACGLAVSAGTAGASAAVPFGTNGGSVDFVDIAKQSTWDDTSALDADGWPTTDNSIVLVDARHNMPWDGPDPTGVNPDIAGTYHLSLVGQAILSPSTDWGTGASIQNQAYNPATNTTTADIVVQPNHYLLALSLSMTQRLPSGSTGTGFTHFRVTRPGYAGDSQQLFTASTLRAYSPPFAAVRFLDTDGANEYAAFCSQDASQLTVARWDNRVHITDAFQGGLPDANTNCDQAHGYAWEYALSLANASRHDMWINVPVDADDDYVTRLATLLRRGNAFTPGLDPDLNVYVEYSNEVWNGGFPQQQFNQSIAQTEGITEDQRYLERTFQIADIFRTAWGNNSLNNRVRVVALWQYTTELTIQASLRWAEQHFQRRANQVLWGIGEAPYYNPTDTSSVDNIIDTLWTGSDATRTDFIGWQAVASYFGLKEVGYESGPSLSAYALNTTGVATADRDPRIRSTMVHHYLDNWFAIGGDLVNFFTIRGTVTPFGDWFLYEDDATFSRFDEPKLAAANDIMHAPKPAITAGYVLPWATGDSTGIDPSQFVPFPFAPLNAPGSGLTIAPLGSGDPAFNTYDYLLRTTGSGTYAITFFGHTDGPGAELQVFVDDALKGTVTLRQNQDATSRAITVTLGSGFHTLVLLGAGSADTVFPPQTGVIQVRATSASGAAVVPSAPHNLSASPVDGSHVALKWAPSTMASSYIVKRATKSGGPYQNVARIADHAFTDSGLAAGKTYYYVVSALDSVGEGAVSPQVATVPTASHAPPAPSGLRVVRADAAFDLSQGGNGFLAGGEILLSWNGTPGAASYTIVRTPCLTGAYDGPCPVATQLANVTTYIDIGEVFFPPDPQVGISYTYTVEANNSFGSSGDSAAVSVTPAVGAPDAPTHLTASATSGGVALSWTPPFGMLPVFGPAQYNVYRSTSPRTGFAIVSQLSTANALDKTAMPGATYYYMVTAVKGVGESATSNRVSVTP
jgi:fibronectin type 3 domain-containing protein